MRPFATASSRERIHQRAVSEGLLLADGVGYLSLSMVRENSAAELQQEVADWSRQGMKSLVLDLRSDPGGLRDEAVQAADIFLDPNQDILVSRGRAPGDNHRWTDGSPQRWRGLPLVVLVNGGTASAAEIIAGALQDHDRALVVGDTTYGKGIVQTLFPAGTGGGALRITTARWFTPSGRSIQGAAARLGHGRGAFGRQPDRPTAPTAAGRSRVAAASCRTCGSNRIRFTTAEQGFGRALDGQLAVFRDAINATALDVRRRAGCALRGFRGRRGHAE